MLVIVTTLSNTNLSEDSNSLEAILVSPKTVIYCYVRLPECKSDGCQCTIISISLEMFIYKQKLRNSDLPDFDRSAAEHI